MNVNELHCPQCGSPVLATANYCVICGIKLPDMSEADESQSTGWGARRSPDDPIVAIPPIDIPEFDEPERAEADRAPESDSEEGDSYESIPDVDLGELDAYLARDGGDKTAVESMSAISRVDDDEPLQPDRIDFEEPDLLGDEGDAMFEDSETEDEVTLSPSIDPEEVEVAEDQASDMIEEGGPLAEQTLAAEPANAPAPEDSEDAVTEVEEMIDDGGPVTEESDLSGEEGDLDPEEEAEADEEALEMIEEGAPVYPGESTYVEEDEAEESVASDMGDGDNTTVDTSSLDSNADAEREAIEMVDEGGPVTDQTEEPAPIAPLTPEEEMEAYKASIRMIMEGAPVYPGESTAFTPAGASDTGASDSDQPAPEANADHGAISEPTDLTGYIMEMDDEPVPMISASYPERETDENGSNEPATWWPSGHDEDWVFSELERGNTEGPAHASTHENESLNRANALIDELRSILPQLSGTAEPKPGPNLDELQRLATEARGEPSFDDWAALREMVGIAQGRPTDIETILQLSKRVDDIAALLTERDRLQSAFQQITNWLESHRNG